MECLFAYIFEKLNRTKLSQCYDGETFLGNANIKILHALDEYLKIRLQEIHHLKLRNQML